ncbi:MAG: molecular chaperone TorD family protein [Spirochaetes bacterium]|nr:molecular chaperone TorD family protein [Spirochaetota bacterium]
MGTPGPLESFSRLGAYPLSSRDGLFAELVPLTEGNPHLAEALSRVSLAFAELPLRELQEGYTRAFDLMPAAPLYAGHHLFGEDTQRRTQFLVRLQEACQDHGIDLGGELPDFLPHVLTLASRLGDPSRARLLREEVLLPVLEKCVVALQGSPWRTVAELWLAACHDAQKAAVPAAPPPVPLGANG